jgi:capsule polysaccharide export protein KpsC/LpsZ
MIEVQDEHLRWIAFQPHQAVVRSVHATSNDASDTKDYIGKPSNKTCTIRLMGTDVEYTITAAVGYDVLVRAITLWSLGHRIKVQDNIIKVMEIDSGVWKVIDYPEEL